MALQEEITALQMCKGCPYIVQLHDVFEEPDYTFLVISQMRGGDLIERVTQKHSYADPQAREVARQLLMGVEFLHSKRIANRNLKPENILLVSGFLSAYVVSTHRSMSQSFHSYFFFPDSNKQRHGCKDQRFRVR